MQNGIGLTDGAKRWDDLETEELVMRSRAKLELLYGAMGAADFSDAELPGAQYLVQECAECLEAVSARLQAVSARLEVCHG